MEGLISADLKAMEEAFCHELVAYTATANRAKQALRGCDSSYFGHLHDRKKNHTPEVAVVCVNCKPGRV